MVTAVQALFQRVRCIPCVARLGLSCHVGARALLCFGPDLSLVIITQKLLLTRLSLYSANRVMSFIVTAFLGLGLITLYGGMFVIRVLA